MPPNNTNNSPGKDPQRQVTLRDIAKELGISHVTVSLALRDHPRISEATRQRVKQKAEEMGYHPDPMLSALSHYRLTSKEKPIQATLAWINPLQNPDKLLQHEEFSLYWNGAEQIAHQLGFKLEEFRTEDLSLPRMNDIFKTRNIRGLLIAPLSWQTTSIDWTKFPWQNYAAVRFGRSSTGPRLNCVTSAQETNTMMAFEQVLNKGYKRIGFCGAGTPRRMFSAGYLRAQQLLPKNQQLPIAYFQQDSTPDEQRALAKKWIAKNQPDAIITDDRNLPEFLNDLGYRVPEEIGLVTTSIHDTQIDAGVDQIPEEIGRAAVRMLIAQINEHQFGIPEIRAQMLVEGRWVDGSMLPDRS